MNNIKKTMLKIDLAIINQSAMAALSLLACLGWGNQTTHAQNPADPSAIFKPRIYDGDRFYVFRDRLLVFDNTNPERPVNIGSANLKLDFAGVRSGLVYGISSNALTVWNIEQLTDVREVSHVDLPGDTRSAMAGPSAEGRVYILLRENSPGATSTLQVYDLRDPAHPALENEMSAPGGDMKLAGNYLYIAEQGLQIYSLANPALPESVGEYAPETGFLQLEAPGGHYVYLRNVDGARIIDVSNPRAPVIAATVPQQNANDIEIDGNRLSISVFNAGVVQVVDISDPAHPVVLSKSNAIPGGINGIQISGNHAFVVDTLSTNTNAPTTLRIYDISSGVPQELGTGSLAASTKFRIQGSRAYFYSYISTNNSLVPKISVMDIANLAAPRSLGLIGPTSSVWDADESHVYMVDFSGGGRVKVMDVSDVNNPRQVGTYNSGFVSQIAISGKAGFLQGDSAVEVIDMSNLSNIQHVATLAGSILDARDNIVLVRNGAAVDIYDITKPNPELRGSFAVDAAAQIATTHAADQDRVVFFQSDSGLPNNDKYRVLVFNVADPAAPFLELNSSFPDVNGALELQNGAFFGASPGKPFMTFHLAPIQTRVSISDDFADGNDDGWFRWSPFAAYGAPAAFNATNGAYTIYSPKSPAPQVLYTYAGATRVEHNFTDAQAQADVTGWLEGSGDSSTIELLIRGESHPGLVADWYAAEFTPRATPEATGTPYSPHPNLAIVRVIRSVPVVLAMQLFPDDFFTASNSYTLSLEAKGSLITARLFHTGTEAPDLIAELQAVDDQLDHGYVGINILDRLGLIKKGNNPVQLTFDNFMASGYTEAPTVRIDRAGAVYWSIGASQAGYALEEASALSGPFAPVTEPLATSMNPLINMFKPALTGDARFYRLRR